MTISLVPMNSASSTEWVMKNTDLCVVCQMFRISSCAFSRVSASSAPKRFVHQQNLGVAGQRAGNADTLLHAARQLVDRRRLEIGKAQQLR